MFKINNRSLVSILIVLISYVSIGCISVHIPEQKDPSLSLVVLKIVKPSDFSIKNVKIGKDRKTFNNELLYPGIFTPDNKELHSFTNIPAGNYRLKSLYAETVKIRNGRNTSWKELDLKFIDTVNRAIENDGWIEVKPGTITYAGYYDYITLDKKDEVIANMSKVLKKTPQEISKAILNESEISTSKGKTRCIILRLDHPAIIGELESLKSEKDVWLTMLKHKRNNPIPKWDLLFNNRISEIDKKISSLSSKK